MGARGRLVRTRAGAIGVLVTAALVATAGVAEARRPGKGPLRFEPRSLSGGGNNVQRPDWGRSELPYVRLTPANYGADGSSMPAGPNSRWISNRVFNDVGQNLFSERDVTQWAWTWGQFMDHTFGLAEGGEEPEPIAFDAEDPLEAFRNDFGELSFTRSAAASGTGSGAGNPRQQVNTVSSFIDGWSVYGGTRDRLEWLRRGRVDGKLANNGAKLLLAGGYLPRGNARGDATSAPEMATDGALRAHPQDAMVAGDVRANENIALTAVHTLFAREHNRIVSELPRRMRAGRKFQIARRVIGAEQQWITYTQFLPALGVELDAYRGYRADVDPRLSNEFAAVGYRAHSMIHGELEIAAEADEYGPGRLATVEAMGVEVEEDGDEVEFIVPLDAAFFNPDLLELIGADEVLSGLGDESQYKNDEQIDNTLRSLGFEVPGGMQGLTDLGALDIERGRDHGMPSYNALRRAYGLEPMREFTRLTGERSDRFPRSLGRGALDDPASLDFTRLFDAEGAPLDLDSPEAEEGARFGLRRSPLAARLRGIYRDVDRVDAFVGMVAEPHRSGSELGELQGAIWKRQFEALRDGDRFFYGNDPALRKIRRRYGIDFRRDLGELIESNAQTAVSVDPNPFLGG